jgi:hypothetical protein
MDLEVLTHEMRRSFRNAALESTIFVKLRALLWNDPLKSGHGVAGIRTLPK